MCVIYNCVEYGNARNRHQCVVVGECCKCDSNTWTRVVVHKLVTLSLQPLVEMAIDDDVQPSRETLHTNQPPAFTGSRYLILGSSRSTYIGCMR